MAKITLNSSEKKKYLTDYSITKTINDGKNLEREGR
jgi:hypothetical protein